MSLKTTAVAPVKLVPVMVTFVPRMPLVGEKEVIAGSSVKTCPLVNLLVELRTEIGPTVAPLGTVALICVPETTVNVADVPLKVTPVAPVKPLPVMVTLVPTVPLTGVKVVIRRGVPADPDAALILETKASPQGIKVQFCWRNDDWKALTVGKSVDTAVPVT